MASRGKQKRAVLERQSPDPQTARSQVAARDPRRTAIRLTLVIGLLAVFIMLCLPLSGFRIKLDLNELGNTQSDQDNIQEMTCSFNAFTLLFAPIGKFTDWKTFYVSQLAKSDLEFQLMIQFADGMLTGEQLRLINDGTWFIYGAIALVVAAWLIAVIVCLIAHKRPLVCWIACAALTLFALIALIVLIVASMAGSASAGLSAGIGIWFLTLSALGLSGTLLALILRGRAQKGDRV